MLLCGAYQDKLILKSM